MEDLQILIDWYYRRLSVVILIALFLCISGCYLVGAVPFCAGNIGHEGTNEGKILEAGTGKPVEGVVVLAVYHREFPTPAGSMSQFLGVRETATDANGEFSIPGRALYPIVMDMQVFKSGYEYIDVGWSYLQREKISTKNVKWIGDNGLISMKKLTMEERKKQHTPDYPSDAPFDSIKLYMKEIDKERLELGLKPLGNYGD